MKSHPFNTVCPYYTMFPIDFPKRVLSRAKADSLVVDPFCGRGTTLFASREKGLNSVGIDSSIVAASISRAKLAKTTTEKILAEFDSLIEKTPNNVPIPESEFWRAAYHPETLKVLCKLRYALLESKTTETRSILKALALGAMHGPLNTGPTPSSFFSNQMMRTFAAKPDYAVRFWNSRDMSPPFSNVREVLERRANRLVAEMPFLPPESFVIHGDSRKNSSYSLIRCPINYVITSPPYYGMRTYEEDQWLRLWFLGGEDAPIYSNNRQLEHSSPDIFASELAMVWDQIADRSSPDVLMAIRFGSIGSRNVDHRELFKTSIAKSKASWKITKTIDAGDANKGRRQSLTMGKRGKSNAINESDFYVRLS